MKERPAPSSLRARFSELLCRRKTDARREVRLIADESIEARQGDKPQIRAWGSPAAWKQNLGLALGHARGNDSVFARLAIRRASTDYADP
jgi:hypothetical protein